LDIQDHPEPGYAIALYAPSGSYSMPSRSPLR
jgi:hypothetical protein